MTEPRSAPIIPLQPLSPRRLTMLATHEAILNPDGALRFLEPVRLASAQRVLVTFTEPVDEAVDGAALSQPSLAVDWLREEEDAAWAHLQPGYSVLADKSGA